MWALIESIDFQELKRRQAGAQTLSNESWYQQHRLGSYIRVGWTDVATASTREDAAAGVDTECNIRQNQARSIKRSSADGVIRIETDDVATLVFTCCIAPNVVAQIATSTTVGWRVEICALSVAASLVAHR